MEEKFWDIHTHLIPGVDDGAEDLDQAGYLAFLAFGQGVRGIFATSHSSAFETKEKAERTMAAYAAMKASLEAGFPGLEVLLGCEVWCEPGHMEEVFRGLHSKQIPTMNDSPYVLVEFSPYISAEELRKCVRELLNRGWIPIIAHAERYPGLYEKGTEAVAGLRKLGCKIQVNTYSFSRWDVPKEIWEIACQLAKDKQVDFLGTDTHRGTTRPPIISRGMEVLREICDEEYLQKIIWKNAETILVKKKGGEYGSL